MKHYLFVGDTHGDLAFVELAARLAAAHDAEIIQVGDWGFVWPGASKLRALDRILRLAGEALARPPVKMRFIDGNHDHHTALRENTRMMSAEGDLLPGGGHHMTANIIYQPRGSTHTDEDGTRFLFVGGAPSIDWAHRVAGRSWWPTEECISEEEYALALAVEGPIHVLVTHDAAAYPPGYGPKGDPGFRLRGKRSMRMVRGLIDKHRPEIHAHGHWHSRYSTTRTGVKPTEVTQVVGLDCNFALLEDATMLWSRERAR